MLSKLIYLSYYKNNGVDDLCYIWDLRLPVN